MVKKLSETKHFTKSKKYILLLIIAITIGFVALQKQKPYYFLQDDNRTSLLPREIHSYRSLVEDKEIAFYNFHQYLGKPHFSHGKYDFYIPIHIAFFLSNIIFGNYWATIDIAVFFHLIMGAIGFLYLISFLGLRKEIAIFAALTWVLNSFSIYITDSWWIYACTIAYLPWMVFLTLKLFDDPQKKYVLGLIIVRLLLFFNSYLQNFIYAIIFEFLTLLILLIAYHFILKKEIPKKSFIYYIISYIFLLFLSLPLLLPYWNAVQNSYDRAEVFNYERFSRLSFKINLWLKGLINPFDGSNHCIFQNLNYVSHIGYLPIIFILFAIYFFFKKNLTPKNRAYLLTFIILGIISLLWTVGLLNRIIYIIPFLNRMRWPFKLNIFTNFYLILIASFGFSAIAKKNQVSSNKIKWILYIVIIIHFLNFMFLYTFTPQRSMNWRKHKEQPPLEEPFRKSLQNGRIISLGWDNQNPFSHKYLGFNYATYWHLFHFSGNDGMINETHKNYEIGTARYYAQYARKDIFPIEYFRFWGIKWYILANNEADSISVKNATHFSNVMDSLNIELKFHENDRKIYYDQKANPMLYWATDKSTEDIEYKIHTNSIEITTTKYYSSDVLMINFLYDSWFTAKIDGKKAELMHKDGQMAIKVPPGKHKIEVRYRDPYFKWGLYIMSVFLLLVLSGYLIYHYRKKARGIADNVFSDKK
jgi:hypothetical protein